MSCELARATPDDMAEIVELDYRTNSNPVIREVFMAPDTVEGHASLVRERQQAMADNPTDYWLKVLDNATGRIIASSCWNVYAGSVPEPKIGVDTSWLRSDSLERANSIWAGIMESHKKNMTEPCISAHAKDLCSSGS